MSNSNKCKGVLFDMDGVLVDSEEFITEAACRMFAEKGLNVKPEDFKPFTGTGEDRFIGGVAEKYNFDLNMPQDKHRTYEIYCDIIKGKLKPLAGVVDFIKKCRKKKLKLSVASSADLVKVKANLSEIGLDHGEFDAIVCGDDVKNKKPAPDIFILAAEKIGLNPNQCLVIEDAISGVQAAKSAGAMCLALTSSFDADKLKDAGSDFVANDLSDADNDVLNW